MRRVLALSLALVCLGSACSSDDDSAASGSGDTEAPTTVKAATPERGTDGPTAAFTELEGGNGMWLATAEAEDLSGTGFAETEYAAAGTASAYTSATPLPADGRYVLTPGGQADYATRVIVRRPTDPDDFNGTVVVEWLNVSAGADSAPDYTYLAEEVLRGGYAWVGVSAQRIGVEGGPILVEVPGGEERGLGKGLKAMDPARYGALSHPGDAYSNDIYTQVARALRTPGDLDPLDGLDVERLIAVGESQSAFQLSTYVNGVQPLTDEFDAFLIHSRGGAAAGLGAPGVGIDLASTMFNPPTIIRTDNEVPVIVVETETDLLSVLNYLPARQPDGENFRLWEVAGTAHSDNVQVGPAEDMLECSQLINRGQQGIVLKAALRHLDTWAKGGEPAPEAPRLEVDETGAAPKFVLDEYGIAKGGIRTPAVTAPVATLSGSAPDGATVVCMLMGSTVPLSAEQLGRLYESKDDYLERYEAAIDQAVDAGFVLEDDRALMLEEAPPWPS